MNNKRSFFFYLLASGIALCLTPTTAIAYLEGHINMWTFDEGSGRTLIDRAGTANGTVLGEKLEWVAGRSGTALHFSGIADQGISLPNDFLVKGEGTIGLWVNMDKLSDGNVIFSASKKGDPNAYMIYSIDALGRIVITQRSGASSTERVLRTNERLEASKWQMLIITAHNGTYTSYVSGVAQTWDGAANGLWFADAVPGTIEYMIGASRIPGRLGVFSGILDDLCFFDHGFPREEAELLVKLNALYNDSVANNIILIMNTDDDQVPYGGTTTLRWTSTGATACYASGSWSGTKDIIGSETLTNLTETGTYLLLCTKEPSLVAGAQVTIKVATGAGGTVTNTTNTSTSSSAKPTRPRQMPTAAQGEPTLPLGCSEYLRTYLKRGVTNDKSEVIKLQQFLNEVMNAKLPVTGYFGPLTFSWVKRFQVRYHDAIIKPWTEVGYDTTGMSEGTGYVYKTTRHHINFMKCASLNAPKPDLTPDLVR